MSTVSSSVSAFRDLVRKQAEDAAQYWVDSLHNTLTSQLQTLEDQQHYWDTLTAMALLDWRGDDHRVAAAQREGKHSYKMESNREQEHPPSARYLLSHPNGKFVRLYISAVEPEPLELIQTHIDLLQEKVNVLRSVNRFFSAVKSPTIEPDDSDNPLGLVAELTKLQEMLTSFKGAMVILNKRLEQAKTQPVSKTTAWNFMSESAIPTDLVKHISGTEMAAKVEVAKNKRTTLEKALANLLAVEHDDSAAATRIALTAVTTFAELDPDDEYDVRRSSQPDKIAQLKLTWQGKQASLTDLRTARSDLQAILDEQEMLAGAIATVLELARHSIGPMLEASQFWSKVDLKPSPNGRVTVMWQELVREGNENNLDGILGGKARYLELARRRGLFTDGEDNVLVHVGYLLAESGNRLESESVSPSQRFLELQQKLKTLSTWSLKDISELLAWALRPYVPELQKTPVAPQPPWPPDDKRLTLSRSAYNMLVEAALYSDRLANITMWLVVVQHNVHKWAQTRNDLYRKIEKTEPGVVQSELKKRLLDLCPDFPAFPVLDYEAKIPPLITE